MADGLRSSADWLNLQNKNIVLTHDGSEKYSYFGQILKDFTDKQLIN